MVKAGRNSLLFKFLFISRPFFPLKILYRSAGDRKAPIV